MESSRMTSLRRAAEVLREEADAYERQMAIPRRDEMLALADELEAMQASVLSIRNNVLEEAACVADAEAERFNGLIQHPETTSFGHEIYTAYQAQTRDMATAIRALKTVSEATAREGEQ